MPSTSKKKVIICSKMVNSAHFQIELLLVEWGLTRSCCINSLDTAWTHAKKLKKNKYFNENVCTYKGLFPLSKYLTKTLFTVSPLTIYISPNELHFLTLDTVIRVLWTLEALGPFSFAKRQISPATNGSCGSSVCGLFREQWTWRNFVWLVFMFGNQRGVWA